ncbi:LRR receptor-like serine/threonine-protein kinase ERL1 [Camellia sinensis]|uniref:LRR receptor-like serine/threonine-protein kinase ERL1 n=1 Tax=Camellia sinensis TaxID=4442 RepID=UPI0010359870|nr:LRR receptor-like serine/threonine-protein kinase ERL1 [Camellia sinensis]
MFIHSIMFLDMQNLGETGLPYLVTLNPSHTPEHTLLKWSTGHPFPSVAALKASFELDHIQGKRVIWFCGAYQGEFLSLLLDWDDVHNNDFCSWHGVFCDNVTGSVVSLNLSNLNLGREISPAIRDLKNLRSI